MAVALQARGMKRICTGCSARFYDLNKRPIVCPACSTEFTGDAKIKVRRTRASAVIDDAEGGVSEETARKGKIAAQVADEEIEGMGEDVVSLEDVAAMEAGDDEDLDELADLGEDALDADLDDLDEDLEEELDVDVDRD